MPRGGRRPGAGAPKGHLNAFKDGLHSQQLREAIKGNSDDWQFFLSRLKDDRQRTRAKVSAVLWWISSGNKTERRGRKPRLSLPGPHQGAV